MSQKPCAHISNVYSVAKRPLKLNTIFTKLISLKKSISTSEIFLLVILESMYKLISTLNVIDWNFDEGLKKFVAKFGKMNNKDFYKRLCYIVIFNPLVSRYHTACQVAICHMAMCQCGIR